MPYVLEMVREVKALGMETCMTLGMLNQSQAERLKDAGLDSLDWLMMMLYLCEIYGIPEEIGKEFYPLTIQELYDLLMQHKTREPSSIEEALNVIK